MSILRRMRDITVATLNDRLEQSEDPVRLIDQYLATQREQIQQSERLYSQCVHHAESLKRQYMTAKEVMEKREQQAMLALKAGEEEVARLALQEKMTQEETYLRYLELYENARGPIAELEDQLRSLRADYQEVAAKRSYYQARMETARLQQKLNERLSGGGGTEYTYRMFNRLEERVSDMEMVARSLKEVRDVTKEALYEAGNTIKSALDQEMEQLKRKLEKEGWTKQ
ncbi:MULTISPECIES: PspA/IM30 family protein [Paenibacillus]|uniref:PspA/IM30 family protein n=1 Tax=Paenibacillus residui TaxID=629724 RepID=A0ABW3D6N3_9BACL|nr:PspA/IM30 family protein [Paenibacillus sp. 32O-W]